MPLYQYTCKTCEHEFEELILSRGEVVACPQCHSESLEQQTSMPGMPVVRDAGGCGDLSLPPCGAQGCRRTGRR